MCASWCTRARTDVNCRCWSCGASAAADAYASKGTTHTQHDPRTNLGGGGKPHLTTTTPEQHMANERAGPSARTRHCSACVQDVPSSQVGVRRRLLPHSCLHHRKREEEGASAAVPEGAGGHQESALRLCDGCTRTHRSRCTDAARRGCCWAPGSASCFLASSSSPPSCCVRPLSQSKACFCRGSPPWIGARLLLTAAYRCARHTRSSGTRLAYRLAAEQGGG